MEFPRPVRQGRLLRRYKRFLADVALDDGDTVTVHCANPGAMLGVSRPGSPVTISRSSNPRRKLPWSLEAIRVGRSWVGLNPMRANRVVEDALVRGRLPGLDGYARRRREAGWGSGGRADFLLEGAGRPRCWVEVKQATLARGRLALFPDARTERGHRHLRELTQKAGENERAVLVFVAARADVDAVGPADGIDPEFGRLLRAAHGAGVEVLGCRIRVGRRGLAWMGPIPVDLGPHSHSREDWE